jgi:hypothetical protein
MKDYDDIVVSEPSVRLTGREANLLCKDKQESVEEFAGGSGIPL